jgi:heat shock protein HslJ
MPLAEHAATENDLAELQGKQLKLTKFVFANKAVDMPLKGRAVTLQVGGDGLVSGQGPVNRFSGHLHLATDGQCSWARPLVGTRMAGSPEVMETEHQFLGTLGRAVHLLRVGDGLRFETADKSSVVEFHQ